MPRVRLSAGRSRPAAGGGVRFVGGRSAALEAALTAAGSPGLLSTYDLLYGSQAGRLFEALVLESGHRKMDAAVWPVELDSLVDGGEGEVFRQGGQAVYRLEDGTLALVSVSDGWARVSVAGASTSRTQATLSSFQSVYPAAFLEQTNDRVPITFWALGSHGPISFLRKIDVSPWDGIRQNYSAPVREALDATMADFEPGRGGQLLLWQGPPGTGKTWALRALASEWRSWAEFHYITDPDAFFVESAAYMVDILLADSYQAIDGPTGDVVTEDAGGKWRILILEDTGELLSATAKEKYGQGLSRLLNVVEGLIGQGLRILCLVTTNDELGELNPAVRRPGRCAQQLVFEPLSQEEAAAWLGAGDDAALEDGVTLAELYARRPNLATDAFEDDENEEDVSVTAAAAQDPRPEIARVAAEHAPEGGYGETAYHEGDRKVFWVCADWTSGDEHDAALAAFSAIDGVDEVDHDAEAALPRGDGWEQIWPEPGSDLALERIVHLASRPL